ncbi:MAG TPA: hypothetical protein VIC84_19210 [Blastocatellia bacterium]
MEQIEPSRERLRAAPGSNGNRMDFAGEQLKAALAKLLPLDERRILEMQAQGQTGGGYECNVFDRSTLSSEAM